MADGAEEEEPRGRETPPGLEEFTGLPLDSVTVITMVWKRRPFENSSGVIERERERERVFGFWL